MSHFAEIDQSGAVLRVIVFDGEGVSGELACAALFGGVWVQTSFNGTMRKNFAGIGYSYDQARDAFVPPKPYPSWILDEGNCQWIPPVPYPDDGHSYVWDEGAGDWVTHP